MAVEAKVLAHFRGMLRFALRDPRNSAVHHLRLAAQIDRN